MYGFRFRLEFPYSCTFRRVNNSSTITSYLIPPYTTIRGMISSAMGLKRYDYTVQDMNLKIGIEIVGKGSLNRELTKYYKLKGKESSPMYKEFIVQPVYNIYIIGELEDIKLIHGALENPSYYLYCGDSESLVNVYYDNIVKVDKIDNGDVCTVVNDKVEGANIERVPYRIEPFKSYHYHTLYKVLYLNYDNVYTDHDCYSIDGSIVQAL